MPVQTAFMGGDPGHTGEEAGKWDSKEEAVFEESIQDFSDCSWCGWCDRKDWWIPWLCAPCCISFLIKWVHSSKAILQAIPLLSESNAGWGIVERKEKPTQNIYQSKHIWTAALQGEQGLNVIKLSPSAMGPIFKIWKALSNTVLLPE